MLKYIVKAIPSSVLISAVGALLTGWEGALDLSTTDFSTLDLGKVLPIFGVLFLTTMVGGTMMFWYKDLNSKR